MIGRLALELMAHFVIKIINIDVALHAGQALAFWGTIALRKTLEWRRFGGYSVNRSLNSWRYHLREIFFFFWKWLKKSWPFYFFRAQNNYFGMGSPALHHFHTENTGK